MSNLTEALSEAYAAAALDVVHYDTLEIIHPAFTTPIRVVLGYEDLTACLEADAPVDPGTWVTFTGYSFRFTLPETGASAVPELGIEIDNVASEISDALEAAAESGERIRAIYRPYLSSDLSVPQADPPPVYDIKTVQATMTQVRATAGFFDLGSRRFPGENYTAERFPGLAA